MKKCLEEMLKLTEKRSTRRFQSVNRYGISSRHRPWQVEYLVIPCVMYTDCGTDFDQVREYSAFSIISNFSSKLYYRSTCMMLLKLV
ncbi:MAG: hypothetical protein C4K48_10465 [Candidatus Thorarchaeota archaeon]|nr:MAG: hypothetical protein C4K48_10465 [Candidatus Thorarchaeota archaeon]